MTSRWRDLSTRVFGLLIASMLVTANAWGLPNFGSSVDSYCTSNGREPAAPYAGNCALCHNPLNSGADRTPLFTAYRAGDLDAFCPPTENTPPEWQPVADPSVSEDALLDLVVVASDPDGDALTLEAAGLPTGAAFQDLGDGSGQLVWMPTFEQAGDHPVVLKATDDGAPPESAMATITIHVGDVNRSPVLGAIGNQTVVAGSPLTTPLAATDPDGDGLQFGSAGLPSGASIVDVGPGEARLEWMPATAAIGTHPVTIRVTDDGVPMQSDAEEIVITVLDPGGTTNRPPQLDPIGDRTVAEGGSFDITLGATDPDLDSLTFGCDGAPAGAQLDDAGDGTARLGGTAGYDQAGNYTVTCTVVDSGTPPETDAETFVLSIGDVNRPPTLDPVSVVREGDRFRVPLTARDPDGDAIAFSVDPMPAGAELVDGGDGSAEFSWLPAADASGSMEFVFTAADDGSPSESASRRLTISLADAPPTLLLQRAHWSRRRAGLFVAGEGAPAHAMVAIVDAENGDLLGEIPATDGGAFRTVLALGTAPCAVRAIAEGVESPALRVRRAGRKCARPSVRPGTREDHGDHDDVGGREDARERARRGRERGDD